MMYTSEKELLRQDFIQIEDKNLKIVDKSSFKENADRYNLLKLNRSLFFKNRNEFFKKNAG